MAAFKLMGALTALLLLSVPTVHGLNGFPASTSQEAFATFFDHALPGKLDNKSVHKNHNVNGKLNRRDPPHDQRWWTQLQDNGQCQLTRLQVGSIPDSDYMTWSAITSNDWQAAPDNQNNLQTFLDPLTSVVIERQWSPNDFQFFMHFRPDSRDVFTGDDNPAVYAALVNPHEGVIIASVLSPPDPRVGLATAFKLFSDYMYLVYQYSCTVARIDMETCMDIIEWVIHDAILDEITLDAVNLAMQGKPIVAWGGTEIHMADPRGAGLLATPIGTGVAWFCGQHKKTLMGQKIPDDVYIFQDDKQRTSLAWHLVDYEPGMFSSTTTQN